MIRPGYPVGFISHYLYNRNRFDFRSVTETFLKTLLEGLMV